MVDLIILDVDNTIIDTNNHFKKAQFEMLKVLENNNYISNHRKKLDKLREIDMMIAEEEGVNEYDFNFLSRSLVYYYIFDKNEDEAVRKRRQETDYENISDEMTNRFTKKLASNHDLVDGFMKAYEFLNTLDCNIFAFSEGEEERIRKELNYHGVFDLFDAIHIDDKNESTFNNVARGYNDVVVVGDSLERDIKPSNSLGFFTIHHVASFEDNDKNIKPDSKIHNIGDLPLVLKKV